MNKASGGDRIPVEIFQILTDDAVKVLHSICQQLENSASSHKTGKGSFQSQRKTVPKNFIPMSINVQTTALLLLLLSRFSRI